MRRHPILILAGLLAALLVAPVHADEAETLVFHGYAWDADSGDYLYTERHEARVRGDRWLGGSISYYAPDGQRIGRKTLDFSANPYVPVFRLELASGYEEGIASVGDEVEMFKREGEGSERQTKRIATRDDMAADAGFHTRIRDALPDLLDGQTLNFRFVAVGNMDAYRFRVRKVGDTEVDGRPAVKLRVEAATLLRLVAPTLELTYDPEQGRLLEYRGVSNLRDPATGRVYNSVRIAYLPEPPEEARNTPGLEPDEADEGAAAP